jgi:hypothetical protein
VTQAQSAGLEPARAEPSGFLVHPLNRLGTTATRTYDCKEKLVSNRRGTSLVDRTPRCGRGDPSSILGYRFVFFLKKGAKMQPPGVEPGSLAWRARILTVRPRLPTRTGSCTNKHPRRGSNPQPPAPETDALPLRHAGNCCKQQRGPMV